jgi:hypothetical protein
MPLLLWFFAAGFGNGTTVQTALPAAEEETRLFGRRCISPDST